MNKKVFFLSGIILYLIVVINNNCYANLNEDTKINQVQILGSHNSYRKATYSPIMNYWKKSKHLMSKLFVSRPLDYAHNKTLVEQLNEFGLRSLEIDIYHDPQGGRYYHRMGHQLIKQSTESGIEELKKPGMKVMHFPDFDYETHHYTFIDALTTLKNWSEQHPKHYPLFIMIEAKELHPMKYLRSRYCTKVLKFSKNAVDSIDLEIKTVFGDSLKKIFTPDQLKGNFKTVNEAVLNNNWPSVAEARGKIIFVLYSTKSTRENYLQDHYSLSNRCMFVFSEPGNPETAFVKLEQPEKSEKEINKLVKLGYIVRTRSDANTKEARKGKYSRWESAITSGAQIISTDYYQQDARAGSTKKWSNYKVMLPDSLRKVE